MQLGTPIALLWGLLAIPIVILYILKVRLRRVPVSTSMFWDRVFEEKRPRSIWQHLRHLLSLLMQLLFLLLLVGAVADPFFESELLRARRIVLVIDNSASMNAADVAPSRLASAKERAHALINSLRWRDEMAVVAAGASLQVASGLSSHQNTLATAVDEIVPSDSPTSVPEAVEMARRLIEGRENAQIIVLSDGCFAEAPSLREQEDVRLVSIGTSADNVGITLLQVRRSLVDVVGYEILVEVSNHSSEPVERQLNLTLGGQIIDVLPLRLEPGEVFRQVLQHTTAAGGDLVARLNREDALAVDDRAIALLPPRETRRVVLVSPGNLFLQNVFTSIPLVELYVTDQVPPQSPPGTILVLHRQSGEVPAGDVLVIDPQTESRHWTLGEPLADPLVASEAEDSPLMRHVDLENIVLPGARQMEIAAPFEMLAGSLTDQPLYATIDRDAGKLAVLSVDLERADLPLRTAFPIMMTNALAWFSGQEGDLREALPAGSVVEVDLEEILRSLAASNVSVAAGGEPAATESTAIATSPAALQSESTTAEIQIASPESPRRLVLVSPAGSDLPVPENVERTTLGPLAECGVWSLEWVTEHSESGVPEETERTTVDRFAVNLANQQESDIRSEVPASGEPVLIAGFGGRPIWFYLAAAGLLLTTVEWYLYQRRWIS